MTISSPMSRRTHSFSFTWCLYWSLHISKNLKTGTRNLAHLNFRESLNLVWIILCLCSPMHLKKIFGFSAPNVSDHQGVCLLCKDVYFSSPKEALKESVIWNTSSSLHLCSPIQRFRPPGCLPFMYVCIFLFTQASLKKEIRNLEHVFKFALVFPHLTCPTPRVFVACCVASVRPSHTQRWSHIDHSWVTLGLLLYNTNISRHIWAPVTSTKVIMFHNMYTYQYYISLQSWSHTQEFSIWYHKTKRWSHKGSFFV